MFEKFHDKSIKVVMLAQEEARKMGHGFTGTEHLLLGLSSEMTCIPAKVLKSFGITLAILRNEIQAESQPAMAAIAADLPFTPRCKKVLQNAVKNCSNLQSTEVMPEHILLGIVDEGGGLACAALQKILGDNGLIEVRKEVMRQSNDVGGTKSSSPTSVLNPGEAPSTASPRRRRTSESKQDSTTPYLNEYGTDLTKRAVDGQLDPVIGRDEEIQRITQTLIRRRKNNAAILGAPGSGKTALVEGLAQRIIDGLVPEELKDRRLIMLDVTRMIAGTKYRGEFEQRLKSTLDEVKANPNILIFVDEMHVILGAGAAEGALDMSNLIKQPLARGEIQLIGATTLEEYRKHIERDAALERRFQPIMLEDPTTEQTFDILWGLRPKYEAYHQLLISDRALSAAVMLSDRYIADRHQPDKSIDLIDEASSRRKLNEFKRLKTLEAINSQEVNRTPTVTEQDIAEVVAQWSGVPVTQLTESETQRLINLESELHERVIGQDDAINTISKALRRARIGLKNPNKPVGTFLFVGPTGCGKTLMAKTLAEKHFGTEDALVQLDMSEFMEPHSVSKLIGAPPGYIGFNDQRGGQLTNMVRSRPYSVVLFDEIEKAHPDVFNLLLQLLDEGHLTDSTGRKVSFKNTIVVMTSNIGGDTLTKGQFGIGFGASAADRHQAAREYVEKQLKQKFRPEFLNRLDGVITFHQLNHTEVVKIAELMLNELVERTKEQQYNITFTQTLKDKVAKDGYSEQYGARPLRRVIQKQIEDKLADAILTGTIDFSKPVVVDVIDGEVVINVTESITI